MAYSRVFTFSGVYPLGVLLCVGLRLWVLSGFQAFLACSAFAVSASSHLFSSIAPLAWRGAFSQLAHVFKLGFRVLAYVSNWSLQRTATPLPELGR